VPPVQKRRPTKLRFLVIWREMPVLDSALLLHDHFAEHFAEMFPRLRTTNIRIRTVSPKSRWMKHVMAIATYAPDHRPRHAAGAALAAAAVC
jgi:hypothetical protein